MERRQELALEDPLLETVHPSALKVIRSPAQEEGKVWLSRIFHEL